MKLSEEKGLKNAIREIKRYAKKHEDAISFYRHLDELNCPSLSTISFSSDLKFFEECQFILNVVISIIAHPHLSNKGEDIVLRAEQVSQLSSDMFIKTLKEPQFWKKDVQGLKPQYVYYYQNVDDLKIYENYFIVHLVDVIESEMNQYRSFYASIIKTVNGTKQLSLNEDQVQVAFEHIQQLLNKILKIKTTYFYKEVSKANFSLTTIHLTNIFLKNQAYRYCFRFYKKLITYGNSQTLNQDFMTYYYCVLLKCLKAKNMNLSAKNKNTNLTINKLGTIHLGQTLYFYSKQFKIVLSKEKKTDGFCLQIIQRQIKDNLANQAKHLLFFETQSDFNDKQYTTLKVDTNEYLTIEALSLWNIYLVDKQRVIPLLVKNEQELMQIYLDEKMLCNQASSQIYTKYCPVCKESHVYFNDHVYQCLHCHSQYVFLDDSQTLWYQKLRRI